MLATAPIITATQEVQPTTLRELFGNGCCRSDVSNEFYHYDRSCISCSGLKQILKSPAHLKNYLDGNRKDETAAQFLGSLIHTRLLEPERFADEYILSKYDRRNSAEFRDFACKHREKIVLTSQEGSILEGIVKSVSSHRLANTLLSNNIPECSLIWEDDETGIWQKIRPDSLILDIGRQKICLDLKSTVSASKSEFSRACFDYDYDLQAAMYRTGLAKCFKEEFSFVFLAVEKEAPFGVALYSIPQSMIDTGQRRYRKALNLYKQCLDTNTWPAYQVDGAYEMLSWPSWANNR